MELQGTFENISIDYTTGETILSFRTHRKAQDVAQMCESIKSKPLKIKAEIERNKRSLDANAYFHLLVGKIAEAQVPPDSKTRVKNELIFHYGQVLLIDEQEAIIKTQIPPEQMVLQEHLHCKPCGTKTENGIVVYYYKVYRGTHEYDTKEMSILIDGTIAEAKELGIETMTPQELERLRGYAK